QRHQRDQRGAALILGHNAFEAGIELAVEVLHSSVKVVSMFRTEAGLKGVPGVSRKIDERTDIRADLRSVPVLLLESGCELPYQRAILNELFQIEHKLFAQEVLRKNIHRLVFVSSTRNNVEIVGSDASCAQELQRADVSKTNQFCRW